VCGRHARKKAQPPLSLGVLHMSQQKEENLPKPRWLNINQLMQILPLKKSHVAEIPPHKIGQTLLFREDEILEWMARNKVA
jgi:hypothetical protein